VASQVYAWIAANPAAAAQLFIALSQNPWIAANPAAAAQLLTGLNKTQGD
jgi:ABC-type nitrate/sulfonate/bicarbonate transport system substrate-binding protein